MVFDYYVVSNVLHLVSLLSSCLLAALAAQFMAQSPTLGSLGHVPTLSMSPGGGAVFNLAQSPPNYGSNSSLQRVGSNTSLSRVRQYSLGEQPESLGVTLESSPRMEGPVSFVAPELAEETLMDVSVLCISILWTTRADLGVGVRGDSM